MEKIDAKLSLPYFLTLDIAMFQIYNEYKLPIIEDYRLMTSMIHILREGLRFDLTELNNITQ